MVQKITIAEKTKYPFEEEVNFSIALPHQVSFPLSLRIPAWCKGAVAYVNGRKIKTAATAGSYIVLDGSWKNGDKVKLELPMELKVREWTANKNSVSVNYGPLTFSLNIPEEYIKMNSRETAVGDSKWQENADEQKWPSYEIHAGAAWNYGLLINQRSAGKIIYSYKK